ncbi:MAG: RpiB/LacA/LacB family sugar-phosphate isomerase [Clostridia bacterium]|nr:RpiB/LacA/LacB family sugar-phosphate isomerase [Clostridia bacterium]
MKISLGCDHAGFIIKDKVVRALKEWGHEVVDHGAYDPNPVDFPDVARKVCGSVLSGEAVRGIMLCGSGVGAAIACNKVKGIRASCCHDLYSAHQCVEHDDVQIACVGADVVGLKTALELLSTFLAARFSEGEEFKRRVRKLDMMDG